MINSQLADSYCSITVANHGLSRLTRFILRFTTHPCKKFYKQILFSTTCMCPNIQFDIFGCKIWENIRCVQIHNLVVLLSSLGHVSPRRHVAEADMVSPAPGTAKRRHAWRVVPYIERTCVQHGKLRGWSIPWSAPRALCHLRVGPPCLPVFSFRSRSRQRGFCEFLKHARPPGSGSCLLRRDTPCFDFKQNSPFFFECLDYELIK